MALGYSMLTYRGSAEAERRALNECAQKHPKPPTYRDGVRWQWLPPRYQCAYVTYDGPKIGAAEAARQLARTTDLRVRCVRSRRARPRGWGDYMCTYYETDGRAVPDSTIGVMVDDEKIIEQTG